MAPGPVPGAASAADTAVTPLPRYPPVPGSIVLCRTVALPGAVAHTFTVKGGDFEASSVIVFDGVDQATTFTNAVQLGCGVDLVAPAGERLVFVRDGAQTSNVVSFMVT